MKHKFGGLSAILSAILLVIVMFVNQAVTMKDIPGEDVYEKTVNSLATYPVLNWALTLIGVFAIILLFWTVEAIEVRLKMGKPELSSNVSRFGYIHLLTYSFYMLIPVGVLHDLANGDQNIEEALTVIHPIIEISLVLSALSSIFLSIWFIQIGCISLKTKAFSKGLSLFSIIIGCIVLFSGCYEALYGRGAIVGIIASILTFIGGFVIWKIWVGIELLRKSIA